MDREAAIAAALLDRRTTALATRPAPGAAPPQAPRTLIIWGLEQSLFATEAEAVAAVIPFARCARVPTREAACLGVIGRAGRFYSVIGMRRLLGLAAGDAAPRHLLLLRGAPHLALAVDQVLGRFDVAAGRLAAAAASSPQALSFEGRLVALFAAAQVRARLGAAPSAPRSLEFMPP